MIALSGDAAEIEAWELAEYWHRNQKDKLGEPYIGHLEAVADGAHFLQKSGAVAYCAPLVDLRCAGYLHDIVEDTAGKVTIKSLTDHGFGTGVTTMVEAVTKRPNEEQMKYLLRVMTAGRGAMLVKLADLYHNTSWVRIKDLEKTTQVRLLTKYARAVGVLESALEVKETVRRAWFLRRQLKALVDAGYKAYSYTTASSYSPTKDIWDWRQKDYVTPNEFIGGPMWDGMYWTPDNALVTAPKDDKGKFVIPPPEKVRQGGPKGSTTLVPPVSTAVVPFSAKDDRAYTLDVLVTDRAYTPSLDYQEQQRKAAERLAAEQDAK